jgi:uncharacterized coiled-coil DUF342 family protein
MGVEPVQAESVHVSAEIGIEEKTSILQENGELNNGVSKEALKSGSGELVNDGEEKNSSEANLPKDAVDVWPEPKKTHFFYFVKYRWYEDQQLRTKSDQADRDLQNLQENRFQITEKLKAKRVERAKLISHLKSLGGETKQFRMKMDETRKEMEPLTQALGKLRNKNGSGPDRGVGICSSVEELNNLIKSYEYRMTHESISLTEEKKLMREIKNLEGTRDQVIANAQMREDLQVSLGKKEVIQDKVKILGVGLDGFRKDQKVVKAKLTELDDQKVAVDKQIKALQEELEMVTEKKDKAYERVIELRKQRDQGNSCFQQYMRTVNKAKELVSNAGVVAAKEFAEMEVDAFMSKWSNTKAFRDDYEKRILGSLDGRQFSRDGRMRNPDEKPLVPPVALPVRSEPEAVAKPKPKEPVKDEASKPQQNIDLSQKVGKEKNNDKQQKEESSKGKDEGKYDDEIFVVVKEEKVVPKVDEAKLKEAKREEEIAKAKQALERKKKLAEKAAAKAALKAQKEAEKKLKNIEKKAKKKSAAASGADADEQTESAAEEVATTEPENADEKAETAFVPAKQRKDNSVKYRGGRARGQDSLPKIILKRKKSSNQWLYYAVPTAVLAIALSIAACYYLL